MPSHHLAIAVLCLYTIAAMPAYAASAGSKRVGGTGSSGKGSHYVGGSGSKAKSSSGRYSSGYNTTQTQADHSKDKAEPPNPASDQPAEKEATDGTEVQQTN